MNFDKEILFDYIKKSCDKEYNADYIYFLYKNYNNLNKLTNDKVHLMAKKINEFEKTIYTINGKEMSDLKKIKLEMNLIKTKYINNREKDNIVLEFENLENYINELDYSDDKKIFEAKKQISILQAKLKIKPSFLYASYCAFEDIYTNIFIKYVSNNSVSSLKK